MLLLKKHFLIPKTRKSNFRRTNYFKKILYFLTIIFLAQPGTDKLTAISGNYVCHYSTVFDPMTGYRRWCSRGTDWSCIMITTWTIGLFVIQPTSPWLTSTSLSFLLSHGIKMVQNWLLLGCHLLLGVWILYRSLDVEQSFTTARNVAITTIVTIFSVVNFWIWICPMNRIRNVRARDRNVRLFKSLIISDSRCWIPSCWRNWEAEGRCSQQSQETQTDRENSATISKWMVSKCVWINFYDV